MLIGAITEIVTPCILKSASSKVFTHIIRNARILAKFRYDNFIKLTLFAIGVISDSTGGGLREAMTLPHVKKMFFLIGKILIQLCY
jgi:hypothetical protein